VNPRERVLTALAHKQPDRVPWHCKFTDAALAKLADYYGDPRLTDEAFFNRWMGNHFKFVGPRGKGQFHGLEEEVEPGLWRDGWGVIWDTRGLYGEGEWGRPVNCVLPEPTLKHYSFPDPPREEAYGQYKGFIDGNQEFFLIGSEGHLFEVAWALRGIENFLMDLIENPEFVQDLLASITEYYLAVIDESIKYGIDAFAFGEDLGSQSSGLLMGPKHWRRFFKPCMARMFAPIKESGKFVYMHSDGQVDAILTDLIEIGLDIYNPFQPEIRDVYEMKKKYGDRLCFHGGIGVQEMLPHGTPERVRAEVRRLIEKVGENGGYILGPAHDVMADVPVENMVAMLEVVKEQV
jgi:uroporphyrinogen decarboxylase